MSWSDLDPIVKITPNAKAYITVPKDGQPQVNLSFSEPFYREIGQPRTADVQSGKDDNAGKIRLVLKAGGKFQIKELGKGGARIQVPAGEGVPDGARDGESCTIDSRSKTEVILSLPLAGWEKQVAKPTLARVPAPTPPPVRIGGNLGKKIDAVEYLTAKGEKISRRGDGFMHGGELTTKSSILTVVNRYRRAADLPDITMADLT